MERRTVAGWWIVALLVATVSGCNLGLQDDDDSAVDEVRVEPTTIDFGQSMPNVSDVEQFTVYNDTYGPITLRSIQVQSASGVFALVSAPDDGYVLDGGSNKVVNVEYFPTGETHDTGSVLVETDHADYTTLEVALEGCAIADGCDDITDDDDDASDDDDDDDDTTEEPCGSIQLSDTSLDFGLVEINQTANLPLTITNAGGDPLTVTALTVTGGMFSTFGLNVPVTVAAGDDETLQVRFTPTSAGVQSGFLEVESCDPVQSSVHISLQGQGEESCEPNCMPDIDVTPLDIDFGDLTGGMGTGGFTVTNVGPDPLHLAGITTPSSAAGGAVSITTGDSFVTLDANSSEYFIVQWTPGELFPGMGCMDVLDEDSAWLTISSDDPDEPTVNVTVAGCCDGTGQNLNLCGLAGILDTFTCMATCPDPVQGFLYCVVLGQNSC